MELNFKLFLDLLGTCAFAISGIRIASGKRIDWFGAYIIGLATAIGGGTLRDLLLDVTPFWMLDASYFLAIGSALIATMLFKDKLFKYGNTLFLFDTIGLGMFTVIGITKSFDMGLPIWVCIVMGTITGSFGGVVRDLLLNEVPLLLRKDIYALACILGGLVYFLCHYINLPSAVTESLTALTVIAIRIIAITYRIHLPQLQKLDSGVKKGRK